MRQATCNVGAFVILVGIVLFGMPLVTRNQPTAAADLLDRYNPVVPTQTMYAAAGGCSVEWVQNRQGGRDYRYRLTGISARGQGRQLLVQVESRPLAPHTYLKLRAKGQSVVSWHQINASALPRAVRLKLTQ